MLAGEPHTRLHAERLHFIFDKISQDTSNFQIGQGLLAQSRESALRQHVSRHIRTQRAFDFVEHEFAPVGFFFKSKAEETVS